MMGRWRIRSKQLLFRFGFREMEVLPGFLIWWKPIENRQIQEHNQQNFVRECASIMIVELQHSIPSKRVSRFVVVIVVVCWTILSQQLKWGDFKITLFFNYFFAGKFACIVVELLSGKQKTFWMWRVSWAWFLFLDRFDGSKCLPKNNDTQNRMKTRNNISGSVWVCELSMHTTRNKMITVSVMCIEGKKQANQVCVIR